MQSSNSVSLSVCLSVFGIQRVVGSVRKIVGVTIAATRLTRPPREMTVRPERAVTETGASTVTDETCVMTVSTAAAMPRICGTPETAPAGSRWNTESETGTGRGTGTERGTERGKGTMLTGRMTHQCRKREVTEEGMAEKRGGARAGRRAGMTHVQRGWEEDGGVRQTPPRKVKK